MTFRSVCPMISFSGTCTSYLMSTSRDNFQFDVRMVEVGYDGKSLLYVMIRYSRL